jgi:PadR family transcriptional regulator, regulatory protein PadR
MPMQHDDRERKKGASEMLVLALLESRERHGYEIAKRISDRSEGALQYGAASLYPLLYRLERRALIEGRWVEKAGERRRRFYRLTPAGRKELKALRADWRRFVDAISRVAELGRA